MSDLTVANAINAQLGGRARMMLGAYNLLGGEKHLSLRIKGSKKVNAIRIELAGDDTYTVTFSKVGRAPKFNIATVSVSEGVYADCLHRVIENATGLRTSL